MQPSQPPPAGAPYYAPMPQPMPQPMAMPIAVNKKLIFVIVALGALLLWIAQLGLWAVYVRDSGVRTGLAALYYTGALLGLGGSVLGALGSQRTGDYRNLGLLVLAGFFVWALITRVT